MAGWTEALSSRVSDPLREFRAAQRTPDTAFRGRFEGSAQKVDSMWRETSQLRGPFSFNFNRHTIPLSEPATDKTSGAPPPCYMPSTKKVKPTWTPKPFGPHPFWSKKDLHVWSLAKARENLKQMGPPRMWGVGGLSPFAYGRVAGEGLSPSAAGV